MRCPFCGYEESKVIDSRPTDENERIRRRRECLRCSKRFTTYEVIEDVPISKSVSKLPIILLFCDFIFVNVFVDVL